MDDRQKNYFESEINRNRRGIYCRDIIEKYEGNYPVWAFIEIISFGKLVGFYHYCANRFSDKEMKCETKINQNVQKKTNLKTSLNNLEKIE